jgi:hypothetical protein
MRKLGLFLLGVWLILAGLMAIVDLRFRYDELVTGAIAIAAGVLIILNR